MRGIEPRGSCPNISLEYDIEDKQDSTIFQRSMSLVRRKSLASIRIAPPSPLNSLNDSAKSMRQSLLRKFTSKDLVQDQDINQMMEKARSKKRSASVNPLELTENRNRIQSRSELDDSTSNYQGYFAHKQRTALRAGSGALKCSRRILIPFDE